MPPKISLKLQADVRDRANSLCEYCHTNERWQFVQFTIDHIIPLSLGGKTEFENLALACFHCNRKKSNKLTFFDEQTGQETPVFDPRSMNWNDHFYWSDDLLRLMSHSDIGRITIKHFELNRDRILLIRAADVLVDRHPPENDRLSENR